MTGGTAHNIFKYTTLLIKWRERPFSPFYINLKENIVISLTKEWRMWYNDFIKVAKLAKILNGIKKLL